MRIVVIHAGGLGDLVLAETLFSALRERFPGSRLELACRHDVAPVAQLYANPPDAVHVFPFNPYRWDVPSALIAANIRALATRIGGGVDLLISAELLSTWLGDALAAILEVDDALIGDPRSTQPTDAVYALLREMQLPTNRNVRRIAGIPFEHELDRYARLVGAPARRHPDLARGEKEHDSPKWIAVFPLSATPLTRWPFERIVAAATAAASAHKAEIVLFGSRAEEAELKSLASLFAKPPTVRTGTPLELPAIATDLARACAFIGVDSGLAHLAAAYGVPGVTVYGGGTWPAYAPWAPRTAAVLSPIPCFGCGWDCAFDHAFCIDGVDVGSVPSTLQAILAGDRTEPLIVESHTFTDRERSILGAAGDVHRTVQADRAARFTAIVRLKNVLRRLVARSQRRQRRDSATLNRLRSASIQAAQILGTLKDGK